MPPPTRPPDKTIRYRIRTASPPTDLSNSFFSKTQVPHTKCFRSGDYIIVGLASDADVEQHTLPHATENLKLLGFELVESQERISARTILARRLDAYILTKNKTDLLNEMDEKNAMTIQDLHIIEKSSYA